LLAHAFSKIVQMPLFSARGRGRHYSQLRGLLEWTLERAYVSDWPARVWGRITTEVRRVDVALDLGTKHPLRIAFASDLHLGPTTPSRTLDRAFALLAEARPDVLLLGGDFVFLEATEARVRELAARVAAVPAKTKLAVLGNHDLWTHHERIERALVGAGVQLVINDAVRLPPPHDDVAVIGLDDPWTGVVDAERAFARAGDAPVRIALAHAAEALPYVVGRTSLLMVGHTHGGQIAPFGRPIVVHGRVGQRHPHGHHVVNGTHLVVSRGVGGIEIPMRLHAPPDIVVLHAPTRID